VFNNHNRQICKKMQRNSKNKMMSLKMMEMHGMKI